MVGVVGTTQQGLGVMAGDETALPANSSAARLDTLDSGSPFNAFKRVCPIIFAVRWSHIVFSWPANPFSRRLICPCHWVADLFFVGELKRRNRLFTDLAG
jgi:hypothetical protein